MDTLKSFLRVIGQVVGLTFGRNLTSPVTVTQERYWHLQSRF